MVSSEQSLSLGQDVFGAGEDVLSEAGNRGRPWKFKTIRETHAHCYEEFPADDEVHSDGKALIVRERHRYEVEVVNEMEKVSLKRSYVDEEINSPVKKRKIQLSVITPASGDISGDEKDSTLRPPIASKPGSSKGTKRGRKKGSTCKRKLSEGLVEVLVSLGCLTFDLDEVSLLKGGHAVNFIFVAESVNKTGDGGWPEAANKAQ